MASVKPKSKATEQSNDSNINTIITATTIFMVIRRIYSNS